MARAGPLQGGAHAALRDECTALRGHASGGAFRSSGRPRADRARGPDSCGPALPGDPRPPILEGSAWLVRGDAERALGVYRSALALGERAELDLNLGRAYERLGREDDARAAFVRAAWISPNLLRAMLPDTAAIAYAEVARLDAELAAGKMTAPPPLPQR